MGALTQYILERLEERSTWAGIITFVVGALGLNLSPDAQSAIALLGTSVIGVVIALIPDKHPKQEDKQ